VLAARTKASTPPCTSQVAAPSSIRAAAASPPANRAAESRVSSVRSEKSHETRAHWAVGRELGRLACRKRPRITSMLKREVYSPRNKKIGEGKQKPEKSRK
jgi:hypothetical protein